MLTEAAHARQSCLAPESFSAKKNLLSYYYYFLRIKIIISPLFLAG